MKNTYLLRLILCFCGVLIVFSLLLSTTTDRNDKLIGKWEAVEWAYEKSPQRNQKEISRAEKDSLTEDLSIHKAERWDFLPNGKLVLHKNPVNSQEMEWTLKGRGNILKVNEGSQAEHYNLYYVNEEELVLYFHTEIQAKGIVRLKFKKIEEITYAEKT